MVVSTGPEGEYVLERPREIVSAVSIDGLEETKNDPDVHGEDVKVSGAKHVKDWASDRPSAENEDLSRMGVLSGKAKGSRVFVVNFVDMLIHGTPVEKLVGCQSGECEPLAVGGRKKGLRTEEVEHVFVNEEKGDLKDGFLPGREGNLPGAHSEALSNWVEQPNLGRDRQDTGNASQDLTNGPGGAVR